MNVKYKDCNLYQKIAIARTMIKVTKDGRNQHGNYNYYQLDKIYGEAVKAFEELGIATLNKMTRLETPSVISVSSKEERENKAKVTVVNDVTCPIFRVELTVVNVSEPAERETYSLEIPFSQQAGSSFAQSLGGTKTYAIKYLYCDLLMLDDTQDDDGANKHGDDTTVNGGKKKASRPTPQEKKLEPNKSGTATSMSAKAALSKALLDYGMPKADMPKWINTLTGKSVIADEEANVILRFISAVSAAGITVMSLEAWIKEKTGKTSLNVEEVEALIALFES